MVCEDVCQHRPLLLEPRPQLLHRLRRTQELRPLPQPRVLRTGEEKRLGIPGRSRLGLFRQLLRKVADPVVGRKGTQGNSSFIF